MSHFGFLVGSPKIGGTERQVRALGLALVAAGHDARVWFLERPGRRPADSVLDFGRLPHRYLGHGRGRGWWSRSRFAREVDGKRLDCLLAFNVDAMEFAVRALEGRARPVLVGSVRGLGFETDERVARRLRECAQRLDRMTCNAEAIAAALVAGGVCESGEVGIVPNLVELPPASAGDGSVGANVLFVGNLIEVKEPALFVRACRRAMRKVPALHAVIVGDGPLAPEVRRAVGGERSRFTLCGHLRPDSIPFDEAGILVNCSRREGTSNALLEAMAHGIPVIATRAGGNEELLRRSGAGVLVEPGDEEALADAIARLASDPATGRRLGEAGRHYVATHHAPQSVVARLEELVTTGQGVRGG